MLLQVTESLEFEPFALKSSLGGTKFEVEDNNILIANITEPSDFDDSIAMTSGLARLLAEDAGRVC